MQRGYKNFIFSKKGIDGRFVTMYYCIIVLIQQYKQKMAKMYSNYEKKG